MAKLKKLSEMPGPYGLPLLGSVVQLASYPEKVLMAWREYYGNVYRYRMFTRQCVVLNGLDAIREGLVQNGDCMSGRIDGKFLEAIRDNRGLFFADYTTEWKKWKAFIVKSIKIIEKDFTGRIEEHAYLLSSDLLHEAAETGRPVEMKEALYFRLSQVIFTLFMGKAFREENKIDTSKLLTKLYNSLKSMTLKLTMFIPILSYFPPFSWNLKTMTEDRQSVVDILVELIDERRKEQRKDDVASDLIECFYQEYPDPSKEDKENLAIIMIDLLTAGSATVANTVMWCVLFLLTNPEEMQEVVREITENRKNYKGEKSQYYSKNRFPRVNAAIYEAMRMRPIAPGALFHVTKSEAVVSGYKIPPGVVVYPNIWSVHHDPKTWAPDPENFRPGRHLDSEGRFIQSDHVIPFSLGSRRCAGEGIARSEILVFLISILERYELKLETTLSDEDMAGINSGVLQTPEYFVTVKQRKTD